MLPIRPRKPGAITTSRLPTALQVDATQNAGGLPLLRGELPAPASVTFSLILQICNSAGIPIIEGRTSVAAGTRDILFADLRPIGIDAYAHKSAVERAQIAERIWRRRVFGTLQLTD